jgi:hypothetical protein
VPYQREAAAVVADSREVERDIAAAKRDGDLTATFDAVKRYQAEGQRLRAEGQRLRAESRSLVEEAILRERPVPPSFPADDKT